MAPPEESTDVFGDDPERSYYAYIQLWSPVQFIMFIRDCIPDSRGKTWKHFLQQAYRLEEAWMVVFVLCKMKKLKIEPETKIADVIEMIAVLDDN